jgi:hypothetical protein
MRSQAQAYHLLVLFGRAVRLVQQFPGLIEARDREVLVCRIQIEIRFLLYLASSRLLF